MHAARGVFALVIVTTLSGLGLSRTFTRPTADAARALPERTVARIDQAVQRLMDRQGIPGLSVAVWFRDRRWAAGYGLADVENAVPATPETVYRLASISKPITAVAVLQLADRGLIDLDTPIQSYVPDFPRKAWPVTCRHLLAHQAGVRWYRGREMHSTRHCVSVAEGLELFKNDPLAFEPGTRYLYSSYGYNLLGAAVEGASGKSYMHYLHEHVFGPAGMTVTRDDDLTALIPHRARGYRFGPGRVLRPSDLSDTSSKVPGGGLCGTASDLVAFAAALDGSRLLRRESVRLMTMPQLTRQRVPTGYGLGWRLGRTGDGAREVWHDGQQPQVATMLYLLPDHDLAVALLCNLEGARLHELTRTIAQAVLASTLDPPSSALDVVP